MSIPGRRAASAPARRAMMLTRADALASTSLIERSVTALLTAARESPDIGEDHHDVAAGARSQFLSAYAIGSPSRVCRRTIDDALWPVVAPSLRSARRR